LTPENLEKILAAAKNKDIETELKILAEDTKERYNNSTKQEVKKKEILKAFGVIEPRGNRYTEPPIKRFSARYPGVEEIR
jgi:transcriptional regulatory protein LevR